MTLFRGKYRGKSIRCSKWNYISPGFYCVTICTKFREHWFGEIKNGKMILSNSGRLIESNWKQIEFLNHDIVLDQWIVMPNHIHGIIRIFRDELINYEITMNRLIIYKKMMAHSFVDVCHWQTSTKNRIHKRIPAFKPYYRYDHRNSIGAIISQFKSICTKQIRAMGHTDFAWQRNYHDHIVRNKHELRRIRNYIKRNPKIWYRDCNLNSWVNFSCPDAQKTSSQTLLDTQ